DLPRTIVAAATLVEQPEEQAGPGSETDHLRDPERGAAGSGRAVEQRPPVVLLATERLPVALHPLPERDCGNGEEEQKGDGRGNEPSEEPLQEGRTVSGCVREEFHGRCKGRISLEDRVFAVHREEQALQRDRSFVKTFGAGAEDSNRATTRFSRQPKRCRAGLRGLLMARGVSRDLHDRGEPDLLIGVLENEG